MNTVYALVDPRTEEIRYVGTTLNFKLRMAQHKAGSHSKKLKEWIVGLKNDGLMFRPVVLESDIPPEKAAEIEAKWIINTFRSGAKLLNARAADAGRKGRAANGPVTVNLRTVPNDLHSALRKAAIDAELSLEQFIINGLPKLLK